MKNLILLVTLFVGVLPFQSQIVNPIIIVEPDNISADVNNLTLDETGLASDFELDKSLWVINTSAQAITLKCKKIEVDVLSGTENVTCWKICPLNYDVAGVNPSAFVTVGGSQMTETLGANGVSSGLDTIKSFTAHYKPMNIDGCSLMRYEWYDENDLNTPLASVTVRFIHTSGPCSVSDEISLAKPDFKLFPNPANDIVRIEMNGIQENSLNYTISIVDIIGKKVIEKNISSFENSFAELELLDLKQGIYIVSLENGSTTIQTERLIVKH